MGLKKEKNNAKCALERFCVLEIIGVVALTGERQDRVLTVLSLVTNEADARFACSAK